MTHKAVLALLVIAALLFPAPASATSIEFEADQILEMIRRGEPVAIEGALIQGELNFLLLLSETQLENGSSQVVSIDVPVQIVNSEFLGPVIAGTKVSDGGAHAKFKELVDFRGSSFAEEAEFSRAEFSESPDFSDVTFGGEASFEDSKFELGANFVRAAFTKNAAFNSTYFGGIAFLSEVEFDGDADFSGANFLSDAYFAASAFSGDAHFVRSMFQGRASFISSSFTQEVRFDGTTFHDGAVFQGATFGDRASFSDGTTFEGVASFGKSRFNDAADFGGAKFEAKAIFTDVHFAGVTIYSRSEFDESADFSGDTQFLDDLHFAAAMILGKASFDQARLSKLADFRNTQFLGGASFDESQFAKEAHFAGTAFSGDLNIRETVNEVESQGGGNDGAVSAVFINASFGEAADFTLAEFTGRARFDSVTFHGEVLSVGSQFLGGADFAQVFFAAKADFSGAEFQGGVDFRKAAFSGDALFVGAIFERLEVIVASDGVQARGSVSQCGASAADFSEAKFAEMVSYFQAEFEGDVCFGSARFGKAALFDTAVFDGAADFRYAEVAGGFSFFESLFLRNVNFAYARLGDVDLTGACFTSTGVSHFPECVPNAGVLNLVRTTYSSLKSPDFELSLVSTASINRTQLVDVYARLESNFRKQAQLAQANEAYYERKLLERLDKSPFEQKWELYLYDLPTGYLVKPIRILATSGALILLFAIFYIPKEIVGVAYSETKPRERKLTLSVTNIPLSRTGDFDNQPTTKFPSKTPTSLSDRVWLALTFSFGVFTKVNMGVTVARKRRPLVVAEWLLGLVVYAAVILSLRNTIPILHQLLGVIV